MHLSPSCIQAPPTAAAANAPPPASLLCSQARAGVEVTERGVTLRFLLQLVDGGEVDGSWTIQQVVDRYVRPRTAAFKCCLYDVVPAASCPGQPQYFVSHTWSRKLSDLLQLLKDHFHVGSSPGSDDAASVVLWLDIVAINQHPYEDKGCLLNDDVANLAKVVAATERTLFCLDAQCVVLTRIWCLYEVWQTFLAKGAAGLLVLMPTVEEAKLGEVFNTFDTMKAEATQVADRDRILAQIAGSPGGATHVNLQLKRALVDSAQYEASHTTAMGRDLALVLDKACTLLVSNGQHGEAEPLRRQALEGMTRVLGADHPDTLGSLNNLANCIDAQGRRSEAEPLYRQALAIQTRVLGADHSDTLNSLNNLAICIDSQGRMSEAEPLYRQALVGRTRVLGADHPDTLSGLNNLAACINAQGRRSEAEPLYRLALEEKARMLGADHLDTLSSLNNLAICINAQGRRSEAEPLYRQALEDKTRMLGADHPSTLSGLNNLAMCINDQGRSSEAEPLYRQALEDMIRVLGADHLHTAGAMYNLACLVKGLGHLAEAAELYRGAQQVYLHVYGPDHEETLDAACKAQDCGGN